MQNVINSVKGTALGFAGFLTPVLKVSCPYIISDDNDETILLLKRYIVLFRGNHNTF